MPRDYSASKIYALFHDGRPVYIGSTTRTLAWRMQKHRDDAKLFPERRVYAKFAQVGVANVEMRLLHDFACTSYDALLAEERRVMYLHGTHVDGCNQRIAGGRLGSNHLHYRERRIAYMQGFNACRKAERSGYSRVLTEGGEIG